VTYWFKKRRWGWGWTPISIEGWVLTLVLVIGLFMYISVYKALNLTDNINNIRVWGVFIVSIIVFAYIADKKTQDKVLFKNG